MIDYSDRVCGLVGEGDEVHGPATLGDVGRIGVRLFPDNDDGS